MVAGLVEIDWLIDWLNCIVPDWKRKEAQAAGGKQNQQQQNGWNHQQFYAGLNAYTFVAVKVLLRKAEVRKI